MPSEDAPRLLHRAPGRVRVHHPAAFASGDPDVAGLLDQIAGAQAVRANALTENVLVLFDERVTDAEAVVAAVEQVVPPPPAAPAPPPASPRPRRIRAPRLETDARTRELAVTTAQVLGGCAGLAVVLLGRRRQQLPGAPLAAGVTTSIAVADGFPELRDPLRRLLGPSVRPLLLGAAALVAHTFAGSTVGLAVNVLIAARELSEIRERRRAFRSYERRTAARVPAEKGWVARLDDGDRIPLAGRVLEGRGCALGLDGFPHPVAEHAELAGGERLYGGPFVVQLHPATGRRRPTTATLEEPPGHGITLAASVAALATLAVTRSLSRAVGVLLLLNPRPAVLGLEAADAGAATRALRGGALPTRRRVGLSRPDVLVLDGPRLLTDGLELAQVEKLADDVAEEDARDLALSVAGLAGLPWGPIRAGARAVFDGEAVFEDGAAVAEIDGATYTLGPDSQPREGALVLVLRRGGRRVAKLTMIPRRASDADLLIEACRRQGIDLLLAAPGASSATGRSLAGEEIRCVAKPAAEIVDDARARGARVAYVTDSGDDGAALTDADLAIGLARGLEEPFALSVDLLVPDLTTTAAVLEAGVRRDAVVRDATWILHAAHALGALWIARGAPSHRVAAIPPNLASLAILVGGLLRLRGGEVPRRAAVELVDPRPERWGRRPVDDVLRALAANPRGLTSEEATSRRRRSRPTAQRRAFVEAFGAQLRSPMTAILAGGAALSIATGALADVGLIASVIGLNAGLAAVQERQVDLASAELERMSSTSTRVLRDGRKRRVPVEELVPGDVLLLASGDHIPADARMIRSKGLEVDESALTGESLPVQKLVDGGSAASRIVLEGSDVVVGSGRAVVFAVGENTRFGATASALAVDPAEETPLGRRMQRMLMEVLPVVVGGGVVVLLAGLLWRRPLAVQLTLGAGTAIAAVPEGLPLLAGLGEAAVARRLAARRTLVRRLAAVEALGRVDVACVDKTGTLTENRLSLVLVATPDGGEAPTESMSEELRDVLRVAALASPRLGSSAGAAHATDVAVVTAAQEVSLGPELENHRVEEMPFDPRRPFHVAIIDGRMCVKGSAEELARRCTRWRRAGSDAPIGRREREQLLARAGELAADGMRVLMVAEGSAKGDPGDPAELVALGFLGIRDTLRASVNEAIQRCHAAGIRVVMLTGDHPETARAIAREAGLPVSDDGMLTGPEIADLDDAALGEHLEGVAVVARIAPLEKVRIVEALRQRGHVVAMTGDGVNDAPALRLADVGVAMGETGTDVARQAGDLILADDDFGTLVDALIEGRTFWGNLRRALAMLLGGNLGEVAFIAALSSLGAASPLTSRQILAVNLVSDVLPAISLVVQSPKQRDLGQLAREGNAALGAPLRREIAGRAIATAVPAALAYLLMARSPRASSVGFAAIVTTQLAQTLETSIAAGRASRATGAAVAGSVAFLVAALHLPGLRRFLGLRSPGVFGWLLVGGAAVAAAALGRLLADPQRLTADDG